MTEWMDRYFRQIQIAPHPFLDLLPEFGGRDPDLVVVVDKETHDPLGQVHVVSRVLFSIEHNLERDQAQMKLIGAPI